MNDESSSGLGQRLGRYARVGAAMGGVAARVAGHKLTGREPEPEALARDLRGALGGLKGPLMKAAQILAALPDVIPPEYAKELAQLQSDAPPMGWLFVKRRMTGELGQDWPQRFRHFEREASAAASLGQVHRAVGLQGEDMACKLQYPDMDSVVTADLRQLALVLGVFERYDKALSTRHVQAEIGARLREELDYQHEARNMALFADMLAKLPDVHVPRVYSELSTNRLLTMSWMEGERLDAVDGRSLADRNAVAMNMFRAWYRPFYGYGVIHGDPHPGNYSFRADNSVNLLDFGCVRVFPAHLVGAVVELYMALRDNDEDRAIAAYENWGFHGISREMAQVLNIWARFLYAPLLEDRTRLIEETNTGAFGRQTASRVHQELRKLGGGVEVPRAFVLMDRAAVGLGGVFLRLRAEVNWHRLFNELVDGFSVADLHKRQRLLLKKHGCPPPQEDEDGPTDTMAARSKTRKK